MTYLKNHLSSGILTLSALALFGACFQGIDCADEGYWLSNARYIFEAPRNVMFSFSCWLTVVTAALWGKLTCATALSYRLLGLIVRLATVWISWLIVRGHVDRSRGLVGLSWGLMLTAGSTMCLYGSSYTGFFYVVAVYFFFARQSLCAKFIGGLLLGVSVYARIPNVTGICLILCGFFSLWADGKLTIKSCLTFGICMLTGWGLGIALGYFALVMLGHASIFGEMIDLFRDIASGGHHSSNVLISVQLKYFLNVAVGFILVGMPLSIAKPFYCYLKRYIPTKIACVVFYSLCVCGVACLAWFCYRYNSLRIPQILPVSCFMLAFVYILKEERNRREIALWASALLLLLIQPLGTDVPFEVNKFVLPLLMPLCLNTILGSSWFNRTATILCVSALILIQIFYMIFGNTRDCIDRCRLTAECSTIPALQGSFTTEARAKELETLVAAVKTHTGEGQSLLVFPCMPGIYAMSERRPFVGCTWTRLFSAEQFSKEIKLAIQRENGSLPMVVLEKWSTGSIYWPKEKMTYIKEGTGLYAAKLVMQDFLNKYAYHEVWSDEDFSILKPQ